MNSIQRHQLVRTGFLLLWGLFLVADPALARDTGGIEQHEDVSCSACHRGGAKAATTGGAVTAQCRACHETFGARPTADLGFHASGGRDCVACHCFHEPQWLATPDGAMPMDLAQKSGRAHCRACHASEGNPGNLSPAHQAAARLYHESGSTLVRQSPSAVCLRCHDNTSSHHWRSRTGDERLAFSVHASHPFGVLVSSGGSDPVNTIRTRPDPRLPLFDRRIECQTCHLLTAGTEDLLIAYDNPYDLCKGCHVHDPNGAKRSLPATAAAGFSP